MAAPELTVDKEFAGLCRTLTPEEASLLEASLETDGCLDPIVLWANHDDTILDGHNRYRICTQLGIAFKTRSITLPDREACKQWIHRHQLGKRNVTPDEAAYHRGCIYNAVKSQGERSDLTSDQNDQKLQTADRLAEEFGVSAPTIRRDGQFAKQIDLITAVAPEAKAAILTGKAKVTRKRVQELSELPAAELKAAAVALVAERPARKATKKGENAVVEKKEAAWVQALKWAAKRKKPVTKEDIAEHVGAKNKDQFRKYLTAANQSRGYYVQDIGDCRYRITRAVHFSLADLDESQVGDLKTAMEQLSEMADEYRAAKSATRAGKWNDDDMELFVTRVDAIAKRFLKG